MDTEHIPDNDPQRRAAREILDNIQLRLSSGLREAFAKLHYPQGDAIRTADFLMQFEGNHFDGEQQIRETLKAKQKFTEDVSSDTFRKKCEKRLFTQQIMPWNEVKKRAAINTEWQWHKSDALDDLLRDMILKDQWREDGGGYVDKGPFPPPRTEVNVQELKRDDDTGEVTLKLSPGHGDRVHFEIGAEATEASQLVDNLHAFKTTELDVSFLAIDSKQEHEMGEPKHWRNRITVKSRTFQQGGDKMCELRAAPPVPIRYSTDGSSPKNNGGLYDAPFVVPKATQVVLAVAEKDGHVSEVHKLPIQWDKDVELKLDPLKPVTWNRLHKLADTKESYEFINLAKKYTAQLAQPRAYVSAQGSGGDEWVELSFGSQVKVDAAQLEALLAPLRGLLTDAKVALEADALRFAKGQDLLDWVAEVKTELNPNEVHQ